MVTKDFKFFSSLDLTRLISVFVLIMMQRIYINLNITKKKKQVRWDDVFGILSFFIGVVDKEKYATIFLVDLLSCAS